MDVVTTILELVGLLLLVAVIVIIALSQLLLGLLLAAVFCFLLSWIITRRTVKK